MGFAADPFREMAVIDNGDGTVSWECSSCGGGWRDRFPAEITVAGLREHWLRHVTGSHRRNPPEKS